MRAASCASAAPSPGRTRPPPQSTLSAERRGGVSKAGGSNNSSSAPPASLAAISANATVSSKDSPSHHARNFARVSARARLLNKPLRASAIAPPPYPDPVNDLLEEQAKAAARPRAERRPRPAGKPECPH